MGKKHPVVYDWDFNFTNLYILVLTHPVYDYLISLVSGMGRAISSHGARMGRNLRLSSWANTEHLSLSNYWPEHICRKRRPLVQIRSVCHPEMVWRRSVLFIRQRFVQARRDVWPLHTGIDNKIFHFCVMTFFFFFWSVIQCTVTAYKK